MSKSIQYVVSFYDQEYLRRRGASYEKKRFAMEYAAEKHDSPSRYKRIRVDEITTTISVKRIQ